MTSPSPVRSPAGADLTLLRLLTQADGEQKAVPLTLYMPWGIASGKSAGRSAFDEYHTHCLRGHEGLRVIFEPPGQYGRTADESCIHLTEAKCYSAMTIQYHEVLRLRAADVVGWSIGLPADFQMGPMPMSGQPTAAAVPA